MAIRRVRNMFRIDRLSLFSGNLCHCNDAFHFTLVRLLLFFFNDTATTEIYTLSLHDALPIFWPSWNATWSSCARRTPAISARRSEEHTSELQSRENLVCRLLLEKKKKTH